MRMQPKLFITYLLISVLGLAVAGVLIFSSEKKRSLNQLENSMVAQSRLLSEIFAQPVANDWGLERTDSLSDVLGLEIPGRITIILVNGTVIADSYQSGDELLKMDNHRNRPEVASALEGESCSDVRFSRTIRTDMLYVASPITADGQVVGVARLAYPLTELGQLQRRIISIILLGVLLAFTLSLFLSFGLSKTVTKSLREMMLVAKGISEGDFTRKIRVGTKDEIQKLAEILNQMSVDLSQKIAQISEDKAQLNSILFGMVEGILAVDFEGRVLLVNNALRSMFDLGESFRGRPHYEIIRDHGLNQFIREILSSGKEKSKEISFIHPQERDVMIETAVVGQRKSDVIFAVFVFHDITELKRLERIRKDFVANVSHELRTPLTSIKGFVEALQDGAIDDAESSRRFLSIISQHTDRMNKIISDLLELSRMESKEFELKMEPFSVNDLMEEVVYALKRSAEEKSQSLESHPSSPDQKVLGDKYRVSQALVNLVDNAIKYTPERGRIVVSTQDKGNFVEIAVMDNGTGIPRNELPRIFERFYTVNKGRSRELGGTGLGLSIVKHTVEAYGGEVGVKSEPGKGSTFSFTLRKAQE